MTELEKLIDGLIEITTKGLQLDKPSTIQIRESFAHATLTDNTLSIEHIKQKLADPKQEANPDRPVLMLLLKTIDLIHPLTCRYMYLNETQRIQIHTALLELLTLFKSLLVTEENAIITTNSGNELSGFLIDEDFDGHTTIGELINNELSVFFDLSNHSPETIDKKITDIINAYQNEVEPDFLRAENRRLQQEIIQLREQSARLQQRIELLTVCESQQHKQTNPIHTKSSNEACTGITDALKQFGILASKGCSQATSEFMESFLSSRGSVIPQAKTDYSQPVFAFDY